MEQQLGAKIAVPLENEHAFCLFDDASLSLLCCILN
jgi:hypothetical protein